ncbi:hypothetical protein EV702DRAFT_1046160 [Suillus placidus]|uniref:Uncharacterized protein n=1 Tax=Suillus placidus TaxID=48579 RepID=A0A9P7D2D6_9AGAM|nr:hypothetical protein EV702DRAFT_1046160 [Suillus placidus]
MSKSSRNHHEQIFKVSNLHSPRETDFESVVVTTLLGPVRIVSHRNHHEQILKVSNVHSPRATDFESVVVATWLGPVKIVPHRHHHEQHFKTQLGLSSIETIMSKPSRFQTYTVQEKQILNLLG